MTKNPKKTEESEESAVTTETTETGNNVIVVKQPKLELAFKERKVDPIIEAIIEKAREHVPDLTTKEGRGAITTLAYHVARLKTTMDEVGKAQNKSAQTQIDAVNAERKKITEKLTALQAEIKEPLVEWEATDQIRKDKHEEKMKLFDLERTSFSMAAADIKEVIDGIEATEIDDSWEEYQRKANIAKKEALEKYTRDLEAATVREEQAAKIAEYEAREKERAEQAEQDRIKREAAEAKEAQERAEQEAKERAEAEEKARAEKEAAEAAERAERDKAAAEERERAEKARIEQERVEKEAAVKDFADRLVQHAKNAGMGMIDGQPQAFGILEHELYSRMPKDEESAGVHWPRVAEAIEEAKAALTKLKAAHEKEQLEKEQAQKAEAEERAKAEEAERAAKAEADKQRAIDEERERVAKKQAEEEAAERRRAEDDAHRKKILTKASDAIQKFEIADVAQAILDGKIPNVKMEL